MTQTTLLLLLTVAYTSSSLIKVQPIQDDWHYDIVKCTNSFKSVIDSLFDLTMDIEDKLFNPDPSKFTDVLKPVQDMMEVCTNIQIDAVKYSDCIVRMETVIPSIGQLVNSIHQKDTRQIIMESTEIALEAVNGVSFCMGV